MRKFVLLNTFLWLAVPLGFGEVSSTRARVQPVCGNADNGIVVGKPRLFDDRTTALMIESLEARLKQVKSGALAEETQLNYQLTNLRSLNERALSDRVLLTATRAGGPAMPRAQVLLAFSVSIDPKDRNANAVAEVEVTITSKSDPKQPATLIALLPKEKTYNVATASKEGAAQGSSAIAEPATGGDFLIKDSDTVSLARLSPTPEQVRGCATGFHDSGADLTYAWRFRPVLGRDRVDAGTREVYALIALPTNRAEEFVGDVHFHTHWRSLKPRTKHKQVIDLNEETFRDEFWPEAIRYNPSEMEAVLRPRVNDVRFAPSGTDNLLVTVEGENFLPDTAVAVGDASYSADKLKIERERRLQFLAPTRLLVENELHLTGRYGLPVPVLDRRAQSQLETSDPAWGLKIDYARARPKDADQSEVRIKIKSRQKKKPLPEMIVNKTLVGAAGRIFNITSVETEPTDSDALLIKFDLPTADIRATPRATVARIFGGELYRDSASIVLEDDITASKVSLLSATDDDVTLAIAGGGFSSLAVVQVAGNTFTRWTKPGLLVSGSSMIMLKVKKEMLRGAQQLTVAQGFASPIVLPLPDLSTPPDRSGPKLPRHKK